MLIKIVKGVYGHREKNIIVPKSEKDGAFELDNALAERLILKGVAVEVEQSTSILPLSNADKEENALDTLTLKELKQIALDRGMKKKEVDKFKKKADLIAELEKIDESATLQLNAEVEVY